MSVLFETDKLKIEYEFENAYLIEKKTGIELVFDDFYGNPKCGFISKNNDWAIIAGKHLTVWRANDKKKQQIERIEYDELTWIHDIRLKTDNIVEILTDPWADNSAIWELNMETLKFRKIQDFKKYLDSEYTDQVDW